MYGSAQTALTPLHCSHTPLFAVLLPFCGNLVAINSGMFDFLKFKWTAELLGACFSPWYLLDWVIAASPACASLFVSSLLGISLCGILGNWVLGLRWIFRMFRRGSEIFLSFPFLFFFSLFRNLWWNRADLSRAPRCNICLIEKSLWVKCEFRIYIYWNGKLSNWVLDICVGYFVRSDEETRFFFRFLSFFLLLLWLSLMEFGKLVADSSL